MEFKDEKLAAISKAIEDVTRAIDSANNTYIAVYLSFSLEKLCKELIEYNINSS